MTEVLLATANQHKLEEFNAILSHKFIIKSLVEFPDIPEIEETGSTLEENAEIKATTLLNYTLKGHNGRRFRADSTIVRRKAGCS
jgi:inosine/xanthosine triphosphate pyrophosphatase family protein